jgi:hypothetical protein
MFFRWIQGRETWIYLKVNLIKKRALGKRSGKGIKAKKVADEYRSHRVHLHELNRIDIWGGTAL